MSNWNMPPGVSTNDIPGNEPEPRRIKCPDCPDGQLWTSQGPTADACPTCGGEAFIWTREPDVDSQSGDEQP